MKEVNHMNIKQLILEEFPTTIAHRRYLHQHPEVSCQEENTARYVSEQLSLLGIEHTTKIGGHGVIGIIKGAFDGPTLMIRADMDALPIEEETDLPYRSQNPKVMHACGHDVHTANLLTIAKILNQHQSKMHGNVKLVFQPAEEGHNGAKAMIMDGVLKNPNVDYAIGMHIEPHLALGTAAIDEGPITAYPEFFSISLQGRGGHGSVPFAAIDPLRAGVHLYQLIHDLHKEINPLHPHVIQIGSIQAGDAPAVIPELCTIKGTVRTHYAEDKALIQRRIRELVSGIETLYRVKALISYEGPEEPVLNDPEKARYARNVTENVFDKGFVESIHFKMVGEDFASYSHLVPSTFIVVGCSEDLSNYYPLHNAKFNPSEDVLKYGAHALLSIAFDYLAISL